MDPCCVHLCTTPRPYFLPSLTPLGPHPGGRERERRRPSLDRYLFPQRRSNALELGGQTGLRSWALGRAFGCRNKIPNTPTRRGDVTEIVGRKVWAPSREGCFGSSGPTGWNWGVKRGSGDAQGQGKHIAETGVQKYPGIRRSDWKYHPKVVPGGRMSDYLRGKRSHGGDLWFKRFPASSCTGWSEKKSVPVRLRVAKTKDAQLNRPTLGKTEPIFKLCF